MKIALVFLAVLASAYGSWTPGLRVRFSVGLFPSSGQSFFYPVPRTVTAALNDRWTSAARPSGGAVPELNMICSPDGFLCGLYDSSQSIAGLQIGLPEARFQNAVFDWETQGFTRWSPDGTNWFWVSQIYFVSADRTWRPNDQTLPEEALWVTGFNKELVTIPKRREFIEDSIFTVQNCIPWMGRHFYYNMSSTTPCRADTLFPYFPLVHSGELIGVGFIAYGQLPTQQGERDWFERPPRLAVQAIVPRGPQCLYDLADNPGLVTMHVYFVDRPWDINCTNQ